MARYEVSFEVEIPDAIASQITFEQVRDWVRFNLHATGRLEPSPIQDMELEASSFSVEVRQRRR